MALIFLLLYNRVQIVYCVVSIEKVKTSRILLNNEDGLTFLYLSKIGIGDGQNLYNLDPEIARLFFLKSFNLNIPAFSWMIAYVVLYVYNKIESIFEWNSSCEWWWWRTKCTVLLLLCSCEAWSKMF